MTPTTTKICIFHKFGLAIASIAQFAGSVIKIRFVTINLEKLTSVPKDTLVFVDISVNITDASLTSTLPFLISLKRRLKN